MAEFDSVIPAGESGTLTARVKTKKTQNGHMSKSVAVWTSAPGVERLSLSLTFKAVPAVMVLPGPRVNLHGIHGDSPASSVVFRRGDGEDLEISVIEDPYEYLMIETEVVTKKGVVERQKTEPGDVVMTVSTSPEIPAGASNGVIKIASNHPEAGQIDLRFSIRLRPVIESRPQQVRLLLQEGNDTGRMALMKITNHRREEFRLTGATASNPELFRANLIDGDAKQMVHNVAVMLQDDVVPGAVETRTIENLVFSTDDPENPEVAVSVLIEPKELRRPARKMPIE